MPIDPALEGYLDREYEAEQKRAAAASADVRGLAARARRAGASISTTSPVPASEQAAVIEAETAPSTALPSYTDPDAFARQKGREFAARFPGAPDSDLEQFRAWADRQKSINAARESGRAAADRTGYESLPLGWKSAAVGVTALDAGARALTAGGSDLAVKAVAGDEGVRSLREVEAGIRKAVPATAAFEGAASLAGTIASPVMRGAAAGARAAKASAGTAGAVGFGVHGATTQATREISGEEAGPGGFWNAAQRVLIAGGDAGLKGAALAKVTPWLTKAGEAVARRLPGVGAGATAARVRVAAAIEQAAQNAILEFMPTFRPEGSVTMGPESWGDLGLQVMLGALFGGATGNRFSDVFRRELGKAGLPPEQADALVPDVKAAIDETAGTPPDPAIEAAARDLAPPPNPSADPAAATEVLKDAVDKGLVAPEEVVSPERADAYRQAEYEAKAAGATPEQAAATATLVVADLPPETRPDGTVAAPTMPTREALDAGLVEGPARPLVEKIVAEGGDTVSSGVGADGRPFAVGVDANGETVVLRGVAPLHPDVDRVTQGAPPRLRALIDVSGVELRDFGPDVAGEGGRYDSRTKRVVVNANEKNPDDVLLHEIGHNVAEKMPADVVRAYIDAAVPVDTPYRKAVLDDLARREASGSTDLIRTLGDSYFNSIEEGLADAIGRYAKDPASVRNQKVRAVLDRAFGVGADAQGETIVERGSVPTETPPPAPAPDAATSAPEAAGSGAPRAKPKRKRDRPAKSLSQWVRSEGGIDYATEERTGGWTGELDRLRRKGSGTTGLVRMDGKGRTLDEMHQDAVAYGYMPEGSTLSDFVDMIEMDATGRSRHLKVEDVEGEMAAAERASWDAEAVRYEQWKKDNPEEAARYERTRPPKGYTFVGESRRGVPIFKQAREDGAEVYVRRGVGGRLSPPDPSSIKQALEHRAREDAARQAEWEYQRQNWDEGDDALMRMGSGLGGASPALVRKTLSAPRNIADAVLEPLSRLGSRAVGATIEGGKRVLDVVAQGADAVLRAVPRVGPAYERGKAAVRAALGAVYDKKQTLAAYADELHRYSRRVDVGNMDKGAALRSLTLDATGKAYGEDVHAKGYEYLYGDGDRAGLPTEYAGAIDKVRERIAANHEALRDAGLIGQDAYDFYEQSAEGYLRRDYVNDESVAFLGYTGGKKIPKQHLKRDFPTVVWTEGPGYKRSRKFHPSDFPSLNADGAMAAAREAAKAFEADLRAKGVVSDVAYVEPLTEAQRKAMGEVRDPRTILVRSLAIQEQAMANHDLLARLAQNPRLTASASDGPAPEGFDPNPIPDDPRRYGALAGKHVPRFVRRDIVGMFGADSPILNWAITFSDNLLASWKMGKTVDNPATHARNAMGNVAFMELAPNGASYFRPEDYQYFRDASRLFGAKSEKDGVYWTLARALTEQGVSRQSPNLMGLESIDRAVKRMGGRPDEAIRTLKARLAEAARTGDIARVQEWFPGLRSVHEALRAAYEYEDYVPRAAYALKQVRGGKSVAEAAAMTRRYFPTPNESALADLQRLMSRGARAALRQTVAPPFFGYTWEAGRIMLDHARHRPAHVAAMSAALWGATRVAMSALGLDDEDLKTAQENSPRYRPVGTLFTPLLPWRDADGNVQAIDLRFVLPLGNEIDGLDWQGQYYSGPINAPFAGLVQDIGGNRNRLTGKAIRQDDPRSSIWQTPEEQREASWAYIRDTLLPSMAYVPGTPVKGTSAQRLERGVTGGKERTGEALGPMKAAADTLLGLRTRSIRAEDEALARRRDLAGQIAARESQARRAVSAGDTAKRDEMLVEIRRLTAELRAMRRPSPALTGK